MEPAMASKHQKKNKNMDINEKHNKINVLYFLTKIIFQRLFDLLEPYM